MSASGTLAAAVEATKRGAEDYILKPFDLTALVEKVGRFKELFLSWFSVKWSEAVFSKWVVDPLDAGHCTSKDGRLPEI